MRQTILHKFEAYELSVTSYKFGGELSVDLLGRWFLQDGQGSWFLHDAVPQGYQGNLTSPTKTAWYKTYFII
jgi:hypothetical protein